MAPAPTASPAARDRLARGADQRHRDRERHREERHNRIAGGQTAPATAREQAQADERVDRPPPRATRA